MDHILFTRLSADGHLCCFHCLAIVNNAAVDICAPGFVGAYVFSSLGTYLGVELLGCMVRQETFYTL